ncbi:MAG: DUF2927 domain-containing protein [Chloroflexota bacterium]
MYRWFSGLLAAALMMVLAISASASPVEQTASLRKGALVALAGTPHLWIADDAGVLHWAGDTRALAGRAVDWGNKREVSLIELRALRRGAPWLSAGLLKDGAPIFFVKWETADPAPLLLHIQSIADVELFGIDGDNYGQFVLDRAVWEERFGMAAAGLRSGVLASVVAATAVAKAPAASAALAGSTPGTAGVLANAITAEEREAFLQSVLDATDSRTVTKWTEPIRVQLRRSSFPSQPELVDSMVREVSGLIGGHPISRVPGEGNVVIDFVQLSEVKAQHPTALGWASYSTSRATGALRQCTITVAQDPETAYGSAVRHFSPAMKTDLLGVVVRHEFGHCLGLGHNRSTKSFMSYEYDGLDSYYTSGSRAGNYLDFDRALLRTLYHASVRPGMKEDAIRRLFGN